jgi:hypothetical protein
MGGGRVGFAGGGLSSESALGPGDKIPGSALGERSAPGAAHLNPHMRHMEMRGCWFNIETLISLFDTF